MTRYHFIGIGGTGLSAIAQVLLEQGHQVSGSDRVFSPLAANLQAKGAHVSIGHRVENIGYAEVVIRSSAVSDDNVEVQAARQTGIPVLKRADFLSDLTQGKQVIAVAGTHGKTTTSAMLAWVLTSLGEDPSYIVGSVMHNTRQNAHAGKGQFFVVEADEYDRMFLGLRPQVAIITHLEHDHPDFYPTWGSYLQAFHEFICQVKPEGTLFACSDNRAGLLLEFAKKKGMTSFSFGIKSPADYQAKALELNQSGGYRFTTSKHNGNERLLSEVSLNIPGEHNVQNALATLAVMDHYGYDLQGCAQALSEFSGTSRRFELRVEAKGITIIDDYAHHPTEIRATLAAARKRYPDRRIWAVWQPHTYSRTRTLQTEFAGSFGDADRIIVTGIYAAREPAEGYTAAQVVAQIQKREATYIQDLAQVVDTLSKELQTGDVVLVLSAGDADQVSAQLEEWLRGQEGQA